MVDAGRTVVPYVHLFVLRGVRRATCHPRTDDPRRGGNVLHLHEDGPIPALGRALGRGEPCADVRTIGPGVSPVRSCTMGIAVVRSGQLWSLWMVRLALGFVASIGP